VLGHQNNYVERLNTDDKTVKSFNILETNLNVLHGKNSFAEVSKNLARYNFENNFVELSKELCRILKQKNFDILVIILSVLLIFLMIQQNYLDLYLAKFLNT